MKKKIFLIITIILLLANINIITAKAEDRSFDTEKIVLTCGKSVNLKDVVNSQLGELNISVENLGNYVKFTKGKLKAVGVGETTISVNAVDGNGNIYVQSVYVKVKPAKVTKVTAKRSAGHKAAKYDCVLLQWKKQNNASYVIYRSRSKKGKYKKVDVLKNSYWKNVNYNYVQWVDTSKVKHGEKYYYKIKAYYNKDGAKIYGKSSKIKKVKRWKRTRTSPDYVALPYINKQRKKKGLKPVLWDFKADKGAKKRAKELERKWSHTRPNGKDCMTAYAYVGRSNGYTKNYAVSENIAGDCWGRGAVEAYMRSPGHRNLLLCNLTEEDYLPYGAICQSGKEYKAGETMPGDVCGISMWTHDYKESGFGNVFVFTVIKNLSNR